MATSQTHRDIRDNLTRLYINLQNESITKTAEHTTLTARLAAIGDATDGTGGPDELADPGTGEVGTLVASIVDILDGDDADFLGIDPTITSFSKSAISLATGASTTQTVRGTNFMPFPLVLVSKSGGGDTDVSTTVVMISPNEFQFTIGTGLVAGTYTVKYTNPLDTGTTEITSTVTFTLTRV